MHFLRLESEDVFAFLMQELALSLKVKFTDKNGMFTVITVCRGGKRSRDLSLMPESCSVCHSQCLCMSRSSSRYCVANERAHGRPNRHQARAEVSNVRRGLTLQNRCTRDTAVILPIAARKAPLILPFDAWSQSGFKGHTLQSGWEAVKSAACPPRKRTTAVANVAIVSEEVHHIPNPSIEFSSCCITFSITPA